MSDQVGVPKSEVEKLRNILSARDAENLRLSVELNSHKKKLEQSENDAFE